MLLTNGDFLYTALRVTIYLNRTHYDCYYSYNGYLEAYDII